MIQAIAWERTNKAAINDCMMHLENLRMARYLGLK